MAAVQNKSRGWSPETMSPYQYAIIALCCIANIADGFDVVSLALAAPVLSTEWAMDPAVLGSLFSAAAVGLTVGAFLVAPQADKLGRRPVMLIALGSLAAALLLTSIVSNIWQLLVLRFITGIGLGTLVVCLNTTVAEFASEKMRNLALAILHTGFTVGMILGSGIATLVLEPIGWRAIFFTAGLLNVATFVLGFMLLGESPAFLAARKRARDLVKLDRLGKRMRILNLRELVISGLSTSADPSEGKFRMLLSNDLRNRTILLWLASLTYAIVGYFLMNWKPTILANAGLSPTLAAASGMVTGLCGALGHLAMGIWGRKVGEGRLTAIFFTASAVTLVMFGLQPPVPIILLAIAGLTTFFVVGAYTGLFLVSVLMYPPAAQNTGLGFVVGFGRIGAIIGPMIGGFLLSAGFDRMATYFIFSAIAIIPAITMHMANRLAARDLRAAEEDARAPANPERTPDAERSGQAV
ncbi:MFS transporter [Pacificimonas sp. ICDLI1SI03]